MPIYLDRHDVEGVTEKAVAQAHLKDMEHQEKHHANFLTYWCDPRRGSIFCLVDAPDKESLIMVHKNAHGLLPGEIIEVTLSDIQAFMGRTTDPKPVKSKSGEESIPRESGFRSILFSDLKGSTKMSATIGDKAAMELLDIHDKIIRGALATYGGHEVKHTGDGLMASFRDAVRSVKCAVAIQMAFQEFNSGHPPTPLKVRIGINAGEPVERNNDLFGLTVQLASRVCGQSKPGQTLVSGVLKVLCGEANNNLKFADGGKIHFKGIDNPIQL